jgi:hypothetical protein
MFILKTWVGQLPKEAVGIIKVARALGISIARSLYFVARS